MRSLINWLSQVAAVTRMSLATLWERRGASVAAVVGVAGVVGVFVAVLSIAQGFRLTLERTGSPDSIVVLRAGGADEMTSGLSREQARIIAEAPGVLRDGVTPVASAELFVIVDVPKRGTGTAANVPLRGVEEQAFAVRDRIEIVDGRRFEPGRQEVIVGVGAAAAFEGLEVGEVLKAGQNAWRIVGHFTADGTAPESEIWTDAKVLQPAYRRGDSFQSVYAKLTSPAAFDEVKATLEKDPRLNVQVLRESEFYAEQSRTLTAIITGLGYGIAFLMAAGAIFGAVITMYTAVSARTREIATLRALGFGAAPVVLSVLVESLVLGVAGGLVGGGLAYLLFDGYRTATLNWQSFSQVAFAFQVTPGLLAAGMFWALAIGLVGGLLPALRAAHLPVATALREA